MNKLIAMWAKGVVRGRWWVITLAVIGIGLAILPMNRLYYDNANERFFVSGDPNLVAFDQLLELFGDIEYLSVGLEATAPEDVFSEGNLHIVEQITQFLDNQPEVTQVRSLTKYEYTHSDGAMMATDELIEDISDATLRADARDIIKSQPMALGSIVTPDLLHTRIVARVSYQVGSSDNKVILMANVRKFLEEQGYADNGVKLHLSGQPVFSEQFEVLTKRDQSWINPTMALVMIVILFFSFRSWLAMTLPWVVIGCGILYTTGIQGLMVWPHSVVESALVPALIIIGIGISVHVLVEFYHARSDGLPPQEAAERTVRDLCTPAFYTALTTAAGFFALSVTELVPVKQFAWLGAIGAMMLFLVAFTLLPAILSFVKPFSVKTEIAVSSGVIARITQALPEFTQRYRQLLLVAGALLLTVSLVLIPKLQIDSNFITYFKADNPTRQDLEYFDKTYNGIQNIDIIIDSGSEGGIHEPSFLQRVDQLQQWLEAQPESGAVNTLLDFHREINQALNYDSAEHYQLPDDRQMAAQFLLLYDNTGPEEDLTDAKDFYERYLRMSVPIQNMDASSTRQLIERIEQHLQREHASLPVQLTGSLVMFNVQDIYINEGMSRSFTIALAIISLSFIVLFRSVKYGLIAMIPSIVPILITGALLVILGIPLNLGTMIVGAMTMGIAVDDAIHVLNRYIQAKRGGANTADALAKAMNQSGRAVIFTSIVLVSGFSVMLLGSFIPYIYTGLFAATIMALALLGDLLFLPALLLTVDNKPQTEPANSLPEKEMT